MTLVWIEILDIVLSASNNDQILYLKFKVSNQKAKFVPREHDIYHRITPYVIVFDVAGDFNHITRVI
jgi:hypothetical protein